MGQVETMQQIPVIAGSSGYLGSRLIARIEAEGARPYFRLVRDAHSHGYEIVQYAPPDYRAEGRGRFREFYGGDGLCVVHLGGPNPSVTAREGEERARLAISMTRDLCDWCSTHSAQLHFISSVLIHGSTADFLNEFSRVMPSSPYSKMKALMEAVILESDVPGATVRLSNVYGCNMPRETVVSKIIRRIRGDVSAFTPSEAADEERALDLVHEDDVIAMLRRLVDLRMNKRVPGVYGSGRSGTPTHLFFDIVKAQGTGKWVFPNFRGSRGAVKSTWSSDVLAVSPKVSIESGIAALLSEDCLR